MEIKKTWQSSNNCLFLRDISSNVDSIPKGVWIVESTPLGELFLKKIEEEFSFDFKIYGLESEFMDRVVKTYKHTSGNMGVLLNGVKGTGKTITGEILANKLGLPIIMVTHPYPALNSFLSSIQQDLTVLIDEYEKVYKGQIGEDYGDDEELVKGGDSTLLSLMDGVLKTKYRKAFILTTNRTWINDNMLNRPGRIRYLKQFTDLTKEQIMEIIDDCLVEKQFKEDLVTFLKPLKIITVDIVKSIVSEINIHKEAPEVCCKDFNLEFKDETYTVYKMVEAKARTKAKEIVLTDSLHNAHAIRFMEMLKRNWKGAQLALDETYLRGAGEPDLEKGLYKVYDYHYGNIEKPFVIRFEKSKMFHSAFAM